MNLRNVFSRIGRAARGYGGISGATIALFIAILVVFNAAFYALAVRYSWYAYTQPSYEHEIGDVSRAFLGEFDGKGKEVKIRFCRAPDLIDADVAARLVHDTAKQLAARHDFITIEYINIYTDPGEVKKYLYEYNEKDELVETGYSVTTESVIIDGGDEYTVLGLSSFYHLSDSSAILAYNGEEVMLSMLRRVLADSRETVYFTTNHGESSTTGFYNLLVCAGYRVEELNLTLGEIPDDAAMIVISNPGYDFEKAQAGSGIRAEIDKLGEYLDGGGRLFVLLDALAGELPHLDALLSEYGLLREHATVRDVSEAISYDGLTLLTRFASGETADAIASSIGRYTDDPRVASHLCSRLRGVRGRQAGVVKRKLYACGALRERRGRRDPPCFEPVSDRRRSPSRRRLCQQRIPLCGALRDPRSKRSARLNDPCL